MREMSRSGFTLVEMLITLTIIIITMAITLPSLLQFMQIANDKNLAATLIATIQFAQREAIANHAVIGMRPIAGQDWSSGVRVFVDENDNGQINDASLQLSETSAGFHEQLYWRSYPHYRHYLQFNADYLQSEDNASFWHCHTHEAKPLFAIVLSRSGQLSVHYPNKQGDIIDTSGKALRCQSPSPAG